MVKIYLVNGEMLYAKENESAFKALCNSANSRGSVITTVYKEDSLTTEVQLNLKSVVYFHKHK